MTANNEHEVTETVEDPKVFDKTEEPKAVAVSPRQEVANLVRSYATRLTNDHRAQQFYAQLSLMSKNNPRLAEASADSLLSAVMACVHLDLMPNTPEQYAFVIPYGKVAQFQLGYRGMIELAYRGGVVKSINAELVFPEDDFKVELGTDRTLIHSPSFEVEDRTDYSKAIAVYATARLNNGEVVFEVLTKKDLDKVQKTVKATTGDTPWSKWPESMAKKTAIKRLLKYLPSSTTDNRLAMGAAWDSMSEGGKKLKVTADGDVTEGDLVLSGQVEQSILDAKTPEEIKAILSDLNVQDRKLAAVLASQRLKDMAE